MIFKKLFARPENPHFSLIRNLFPKNFDFKQFEIYYMTSFEFTDKNLLFVDSEYSKGRFLEVLLNLEYNSQSNNISAYYFRNINEKQGQIYLITDPLELYEKEEIIRQFDLDIDCQTISQFEKIN